MASTKDNGVLIADADGVFKVSLSGLLDLLADASASAYNCREGPPPLLFSPDDVATTAGGGVLIADSGWVSRIDPDGSIKRVAGDGCSPGGTGDGGPATAAGLYEAAGVSTTSDGGLLIAEVWEDRVRRVSPGGIISTVAGNGRPGFRGDGGQATAARLAEPNAVAATPDGGFLIADTGNDRIRRVSPDGTISTVAGRHGFRLGDGGPARRASLQCPRDVVLMSDGGFLIADPCDGRIRKVGPDGTISTFAGGGRPTAFGGDGVDSRATSIAADDLALTSDGGLLFVDRDRARIRLIAGPASARLAMAISPRTRARGRQAVIDYASTGSAIAHFEVSHRGRQLASFDQEARAGQNQVRLPVRLRAGEAYVIELTATSGAGQVATDRESVIAGGLLRMSLARRAARAELREAARRDGENEYSLRRCRRRRATRMHCSFYVGSHNPGESGPGCISIVLQADGQLYVGGCPRTRRGPRHLLPSPYQP